MKSGVPYPWYWRVRFYSISLYCIELLVMAFFIRWHLSFFAIILAIAYFKFSDCMPAFDSKSTIAMDNIGIICCVAFAGFVFIVLLSASLSFLLAVALSFILPAVTIVCLLADRGYHQQAIRERIEEEIAAISYKYGQDAIAHKMWNLKYGHLTMKELPVAVLRNFTDLEHHRKYIEQINDQNILADYAIGRNGFVKNRNDVFPEDTNALQDAVDKITEKALLLQIAEKCGNWEIRAYVYGLLRDRINYLRAIISQPIPNDIEEAAKALYPSYSGESLGYSRTAGMDVVYSKKRQNVLWAQEELDLLEKSGNLTADEESNLEMLNRINVSGWIGFGFRNESLEDSH